MLFRCPATLVVLKDQENPMAGWDLGAEVVVCDEDTLERRVTPAKRESPNTERENLRTNGWGSAEDGEDVVAKITLFEEE